MDGQLTSNFLMSPCLNVDFRDEVCSCLTHIITYIYVKRFIEVYRYKIVPPIQSVTYPNYSQIPLFHPYYDIR